MQLTFDQLTAMIGELYIENRVLKMELAKALAENGKSKKNARRSGSSPEAG